jgi:hypothetical protein
MDDLLDWLQEMIDNQAYGIPHLTSAPITKCVPCIACNNHINVTDPRGWSRAFVRKLGATAWEVFDLRKLDLTWIGTAMMASGTCGISITGTLTLHTSNLSRQQGMQYPISPGNKECNHSAFPDHCLWQGNPCPL